MWRNRFEVEYAGRGLTVEPATVWNPVYRVGEGGAQTGEVRRRAWYSSTLEADLPGDLPLAVRVFVLWLVLVVMLRDEAAAAGGGGGA